MPSRSIWFGLIFAAFWTTFILLVASLSVVTAGTFVVRASEDFVRTNGNQEVFTRKFTLISPPGIYTMRVYNGGRSDQYELVSSAIITVNGVAILQEQDFNQQVSLLSRPVNLLRDDTFSVDLRSRPGSGLTIEFVGTDDTPPLIRASVSPTPNVDGWNNTNVTVTFVCSDENSGIANCPEPITVTKEGANQAVSGTAKDVAGNTAIATVAINVDKTPPSVTASRSPAANARGWNNTNVTVSFAGTDTLSGIASCSAPVTLSSEGKNQTASGTCTDKAGNTSPASTVSDINIDKTLPTLTFGAAAPAANAAGWNNTNVAVPFTVTDALSGVATTNPTASPLVLATEGSAVTGTITVTDIAGNNATFTSPSFKIDKTPPVVTITSPADGSTQSAASLSLAGTALDPLSGLATLKCNSVPLGQLSSPFTCNLTLTVGQNSIKVDATDLAGNSTSANETIFYVPARISSVVPNTGQQRQQNLSVTITGEFTHFVQGMTTASFGVDIVVASLTVTSTTAATAVLNIDPAAATGARNVTLTTNAEVVTLNNGFSVTAGTPTLTLVNPNTGQQGQQNLSVSMTGLFTHFVQGTTTASFGAGITVASLTVNSATTATALLNIDPTAATGARNVTLTTNAEVATLNNGFTVTAGTPVLTLVNPNMGQQGQQNLSVSITGQFTNFVQGATQVSFGAGISVVSLVVISTTSVTAVINIDLAAPVGIRTITVSTGAEVASLPNAFTVALGNPFPVAVDDAFTLDVTDDSGNRTVLDPQFQIERFVNILSPWSLAVPPVGGPFGEFLYVASYPNWNGPVLGSPESFAPLNPIFRVGLGARNIQTFFVLPAESGPFGDIVFGPGAPFTSDLYISSNNRDGGQFGDFGGSIVFLGVEPELKGEQFLTPVPPPTVLSEPGLISFGPGGGFGTDLYVRNTTEPPYDIARISPSGNRTSFLTARDDMSAGAAMTFGGGAFASGLYMVQPPNQISMVDADGKITPFVLIPGVVLTMAFAGGGPFGYDLYVTAKSSTYSSLFRVGPTGTVTELVRRPHNSTPPNVELDLSLAFSRDGQSLFLGNTSDNAIFRLSARPGIAGSVLANDSSPRGAALSTVLVNGPSHGTLKLNADGTFYYSPNPGFGDVDTFTYKANDGTQDSNAAEVTIRLNRVNRAPLVTVPPSTTVRVVDTATLTGLVSDDGAPANSVLSIAWSRVSGPGTVAFTSPNAAVTNAKFSAPGNYVLRLNATDSILSSASEMTVRVVDGLTPFSLSPNSGQQGQQGLSVTIHAETTYFAQGATNATFGGGITVASLVVNSPWLATAVLNIDPAASIGPRTVTLTTGTKVATLVNGFSVTAGTPALTLVSPNSGQQGQQNLLAAITGQSTHFVQGSSQVSFGAGITVGTVTVASISSLTAQITIATGAAVGGRSVTVTTGAEVASLGNAFTVQPGTPVLLSVTPNVGQQNQTILVTISGQFTNFLQGSTQASFGDGISVGGGPLGGFGPVTVISATSATAQINVNLCALTGPRTVMLKTGTESETLPGGFSVATATIWSQLDPTGTRPSPRIGYTTVYDSAADRMIMFGGGANLPWISNEVWVLANANGLNGTPVWTKLNPTGSLPPARRNHGAAYDSTNNRMIIFGGDISTTGSSIPVVNDVWVLTNANGLGGTPAWVQLLPQGPAPESRRLAVTSYDSATNRLTVFGGWTNNLISVNDVWVLSNANGLGAPTWTQLAPAGQLPSPRNASFFASDALNNRLTIFGGETGQNPTNTNLLNDVWVLSGANGLGGTPTWIQLIPDGAVGSPSGRAINGSSASPYNAGNNRLIVVGGALPSVASTEVWLLLNANGLGGPASWINLASQPVPVPVEGGGTTYDPSTDRVIQFGWDTSNDTFVLANATNLPVANPIPRLLSVIPSVGQPGQAQSVTLTGTCTSFIQGFTQALFGQGISVGGSAAGSLGSVSVTSPTFATAQLAIDASANLGLRDVRIQTASEASTLVNGFRVTSSSGPAITTISPNTGQQGQPSVPITIVGQGTHFSNSSVIDLGAGITVTNVTTAGVNTLSGQMSIAGNAPLGARSLTITTGSEVVFLANAFIVITGSPANLAPSVSAGADQTITFPSTAALNGSVVDDGRPLGANLTISWTTVGANVTPDWLKLAPTGGPPPPEYIHASAFDPSTNRMIIFGGATSGAPAGTNDVWVLANADGLGGIPQWSKLTPVPDSANGFPAARSAHTIVYDSNSNRMIVFGGCRGNCGPTSNDTWVLTNANGLGGTPAWIQLLPTGGPPAPRNGHTAVYDAGTNTMIVFGGSPAITPNFFNDVWVLRNANGLGGVPIWVQLSPSGATPPTLNGATAVYDSLNNRMIVFGGFISTSPATTSNAVWALGNANGLGGTPAWTNLIAEGAVGSPSPRANQSAVYDTVANRMTIFDGRSTGSNLVNDTWVLTNANGLGPAAWTQIFPTDSPPQAREAHTAVLNVASNRMIVFGGISDPTQTGATLFNDTWVLANSNGGVLFSSPTFTVPDVADKPYAAATTATFPGPGTYLLRLTATDSALTAIDDVQVVVNGAPALTQVSPNTGRQGQKNLLVAITGQNTHFVQNTTQINFGAGITLGTVTVTSATTLSALITIAANAAIGQRTVTVTTGTEVGSLANAFTVQAGTPALLSVTPNIGQIGQTILVTITGEFTNFLPGTTQASFGDGISVEGGPQGSFGPLNVLSPTSATAQINILCALIGPRTVIVQTGSESVTLNSGFSVTTGLGSAQIALTEYPLPLAASFPAGITCGPDGNLWFTEAHGNGNTIGRITTSGMITEFPIPTVSSVPTGIAAGSDGNFWFTEKNANKIGRITPAGVITEFPVPGNTRPYWITAGPDGNLWFTESGGNMIGRITTAGTITEFSPPTTSVSSGITSGPDGNLWFIEQTANKIARITPGGMITEFPVPGSYPTNIMYGITTGLDGNLWFTDVPGNTIGRITPAGVITQFPLPTSGSEPVGITAGPDGNLWFTEQHANQIGRISTAGVITEFPVPTAGSLPQWITTGPDGNLWFTEDTGSKIVKVTPGSLGTVPILLSINPSTAPQGQQNLSVTITGQFTSFAQATSQVGFGAGVTVNSVTVLSGTVLTANISIPASAAGGPRTVTVTTGREVASLVNGFSITVPTTGPSITTISPNSGQQGQSGPVGIVGQNTHFVQGTTQADFGAGIIVSNISVTCSTCLTAQLQIAATAVLGSRTVTVTTGSEGVSLPNGFIVQPGTPVLTSMNPASARQGQAVTSTITGQFTHWVQGTTTVSLGAGIAVNTVMVANPTTLTVQLTVATDAALGLRNLTVTTGTEVVSAANVFNVLAGVPVIVQPVNPDTGKQGQMNLSVSISGAFTHFLQGATVVDFGQGITVNQVTVSNPTNLTANISIVPSANLGPRNITITSGSEVVVASNGFTVISSTTNQAPIVNAGLDQTVTLPAKATLNGSVTDDGLPVGGTLTITWGIVSGPGNVAVTNPNSPITDATFGASGVYVLRLTASDSQLAAFDEVTITVNPPTGANQPPTVNAGPNQTITLGSNLLVNPGADLPTVNGNLPAWTQVSGNQWSQAPAGTGQFPLGTDDNTYFYAGQVASAELRQDVDISALAAAIDAGQQQIELKAQMYVPAESVPDSGRVVFEFLDSTKNFVIASSFFQSSGSGNIWTPAVRIRSVPAQARWVRVRLIATMNTGPSNDAFFDSLSVRALSAGALLAGTATDDGLPVGSTFVTTWSKVSGPGTVSFANAGSPTTAANFSTTGVYVLRLTGDDSQFNRTSDVTITVVPGNVAPDVDAGPDFAIQLPATATLAGAAVDDGLPTGSTLAIFWSKISGPGTVTFSPPGAPSTIASFSAGGTYLLRLTASDSQYTVHSYVTITVIPSIAMPAPSITIVSPAEGDIITSQVNVSGTVTSSTLANWTLEYGREDLPTRKLIGSGTTPVVNGSLGSLDPTLLLNGQSQLILTAFDTAGQTSTFTVNVVIDRNQKVGNFTVSFNDLSVPVAGIPIEIVRTYDSRDKRKGDFGIGWQLAIKSPQVQKAGALGVDWVGTASNTCFGCIPIYCIEPVVSKTVTITFPDGQVFAFEPDLLRTDNLQSVHCTLAVPPLTLTVHFAFNPLPGTTATLSAIGSSQVFINGSFPGPIELLDADTFTDIWDTQRFRLVLQDGRALEFNGLAGLQRVTDLSGNALTITSAGITHSSGKGVLFSRDLVGRITQITDPAGNSITYTYNVFGDLVSFKDRENNVTTFSYNSTHGLLQIQDPRGINPLRNVYDNDGRLIQHIDAFGKVINYTHSLGTRQETITDRLGNVTVHEYDTHGNVVRTTDANGGITARTYDSLDDLLTETDPLGRQRRYTYDSQKNRLTETDAAGSTTTYTYNSRGQVLTVTDPLGRTTTNTYDANGNLTSTRDPSGNVTSYTYNAAGLRTSMKDALNNVTTYVYDGAGNLTRQVDAAGHATDDTYDANGNRLTQTTTRTTSSGQETLVTSYQYDKLNRLTKTTFPDGSTTQTIYNNIGKQSATIDQLNRQTTYQYDDLGRLSQTNYPDATNESSAYDAEGRRVSATDRGGRTTTFQYDALGRLMKTTHPDSTFTTTVYDLAGQVSSTTDERGSATQYQYDSAGRRTKVINALSLATTFAYDAVGNQTSMTDANGNPTQYVYDANNRRTRVTYPDSTFDQTDYDALSRSVRKIDQAGIATQFIYDSLGRLTQVIDALNQITRYAYDELGNRISQQDANNHTTSFDYDKLRRRTKRTLPLGMFESYVYNAAGNTISKTDSNGRTTSYTYDTVNRLTSEIPDPALGETTVSFSYFASGQRSQMVDASGTTTYQYDLRDRLLQKVTPQGTLTYTYDAAGNQTSVRSSNANGTSVGYEYDQLNRLKTVTDQRLPAGSNTTTYNYDPAGNLQSYLYPNGVRTTHTYNTLNRLSNLTIDKGGSALGSFAYTLGASGNRTSVTELGGRRVDYGYDSLYRLTDESIVGAPVINGAIHYVYDAVGNRLTRTSTVAPVPAASYSYDQNNRLASDTYDQNGNTINSGGVTYTYDFKNRLKTQNNPAVSIVYDGNSNRIAKTAVGVTTRYLVDDRNLTGYSQVLEELQSGTVQRVYTYGLNRISQSQAGATSFYGYDGHGNVRMLTDPTGAVSDTYDYDAFGVQIQSAGVTPNDYRYAGEQNDINLGMIYLRERYLSTATGRFWTADPLTGLSSAPWMRRLLDVNSNLYRYAASDPVNRTDPTGLYWTLPQQALAVGVLTTVVSYGLTQDLYKSTKVGLILGSGYLTIGAAALAGAGSAEVAALRASGALTEAATSGAGLVGLVNYAAKNLPFARETIFYFGGKIAADGARILQAANPGTITLETTNAGRILGLLETEVGRTPQIFEAGAEISEMLATRAAGVQRIVVGANPSTYNLFSQAEFLPLINNTSVTTFEFYAAEGFFGGAIPVPFLQVTRQALEAIWRATN